MLYSKTRNKWSVWGVVPDGPQRIYFIGEVTNFEGKRFVAIWKDDMDSDGLDIVASVPMTGTDKMNSEALRHLADLLMKLHTASTEKAGALAANEPIRPTTVNPGPEGSRVIG